MEGMMTLEFQVETYTGKYIQKTNNHLYIAPSEALKDIVAHYTITFQNPNHSICLLYTSYQKVIHAIELLHRKKLIYGISACYTSANFDSITSEEFYDKLIEMGVYFIWYFHYMPVGNDAVPALMPTPKPVSYTHLLIFMK